MAVCCDVGASSTRSVAIAVRRSSARHLLRLLRPHRQAQLSCPLPGSFCTGRMPPLRLRFCSSSRRQPRESAVTVDRGSHPQLVDTWSLRSFPATSIFGAIRPKSSLETAKPRQSLQVLARPTGSPPEQMLQATPTSCAASRHSHARRRRAAMCTVVRAHTWHELTHTRQ